jgi:protease I
MKKALIITNTGFQDHELVYPYYRLLAAGFDVDIVADKRDEQGRVYGILGVNMPCTVLLQEFAYNVEYYLANYDFLVIPGGVKAMEKLRQVQSVLDFVSRWNKQGKVIASTCSGAQILISAKVVQGRNISAYYGMKDDVINAGANFIDSPSVIDGNIVSSPHYDHMGKWMEDALELYSDKHD